MVKITNGLNIFEVTRGAFDGIFSHQGYTIIDEIKEQVNAPEVLEKTKDEKLLNEIIEKPISQWSKEEVKKFAALKEINITGTKNVTEAKELIKKFIEAEE